MYDLSQFYMAVLVQLRFHLSASADKRVKGPLAMLCSLMHVNCLERGHRLGLGMCTRCAFIHKVGKPANCMYQTDLFDRDDENTTRAHDLSCVTS